MRFSKGTRKRCPYCTLDLVNLMSDLLLLNGLLLALNTFKELVEGVRKLLHTLIQQLLSNLIVMNANFLKRVKFCIRLGNVVLDAVTHLTMIAEVLDGLQRHRINRMGANEFLCIQYITIGRS